MGILHKLQVYKVISYKAKLEFYFYKYNPVEQ